MCGIFGVSGLSDAAKLTYLGLYALQHRGQESAGIVSVDDALQAHSHRGMGLVQDVITPEVLRQLPGTTTVGHTRYSTVGSSALLNAQPCLVNYHSGPLALAHNGNLTNAAELRADLVRSGSIFQSTSDSEVIIHLIARSQAREPEDQILDAMERIEGAYSLVLTIGKTLYAAVDARGFRPLVVGKLKGGFVVGSESCSLDIVGATTIRELQPGEWIKIENGTLVDLPDLSPKPHRRCVFELVYFSRPDSVVFGSSVERVRRELGRQLAKERPVPEGVDCVFSVPDSSNAMALGFAEESGLKLEHGLIRNHYVGRTFINPEPHSRIANVRIKYSPVREVLEGKSVAIVDDSLVRGTTSKSLIQMVRQAGAREIHLRIASAPITGPCYYGINTPTKEELIAANHSEEEIRQHLGVESLGYLSIERMLQAAGSDPSTYCHACFSGDYPTRVPERTFHRELDTSLPAAT